MSWFSDDLQAIDPSLRAEQGLQALGGNERSRVAPDDPRRLEGSCDLDEGLRWRLPNDPRWDYVIAYDAEVWAVELHSASSPGHVDEVVAKARWLRSLIRGSPLARRLRGLYWLAVGPVTRQPAFSRRSRQLAQEGVRGPQGSLKLGR